MAIYLIIGSLFLFYVLLMAWRGLDQRNRQQDSALKQRAMFNINEQLTYTRLKEILPNATILSHVSFDSLLTTKFSHTRHKYRNMTADFVILNEHYQVLAVVSLDDPMTLKRSHLLQYQDALLESAGYRVIRYDDVPEYQQIRQDFVANELPKAKKNLSFASTKVEEVYTPVERQNVRLMS